MKVTTIAELRAVIELLVEHDIASFEVEGLKLFRTTRGRVVDYPIAVGPNIPEGNVEAEDEDLEFWSAGGAG